MGDSMYCCRLMSACLIVGSRRWIRNAIRREGKKQFRTNHCAGGKPRIGRMTIEAPLPVPDTSAVDHATSECQVKELYWTGNWPLHLSLAMTPFDYARVVLALAARDQAAPTAYRSSSLPLSRLRHP